VRVRYQFNYLYLSYIRDLIDNEEKFISNELSEDSIKSLNKIALEEINESMHKIYPNSLRKELKSISFDSIINYIKKDIKDSSSISFKLSTEGIRESSLYKNPFPDLRINQEIKVLNDSLN
jgi:hypothetical protein